MCAHNLAKTLALITVDRIEQATGERRIDPLGGLGRLMPFSAVALGVSSLTLAAIPPLGGFVSEWFTFEALLQGFRMPTPAVASALRAGRRRAGADGRARSSRVREVLQLHLPRAGA